MGGQGGGGEEPHRRPGRVLVIQAAATYIALSGDSIVTLDRVCLPACKNHGAGHLGLGSVRNRGTFGRGLKQTQHTTLIPHSNLRKSH